MDTSSKISLLKEDFVLGEERIRPQDIPWVLWKKIIEEAIAKLRDVTDKLPFIEISDRTPLNSSLWGTRFFLPASPGREPLQIEPDLEKARLYPLCALGSRDICPPPRTTWVNDEGPEDYILYSLPHGFVRLRRVFDYKGPQGENSISIKGHKYSKMRASEINELFKSPDDCCRILKTTSHLFRKTVEDKEWTLKTIRRSQSRVNGILDRIEGFEKDGSNFEDPPNPHATNVW
jgi:hypothetical protein